MTFSKIETNIKNILEQIDALAADTTITLAESVFKQARLGKRLDGYKARYPREAAYAVASYSNRKAWNAIS